MNIPLPEDWQRFLLEGTKEEVEMCRRAFTQPEVADSFKKEDWAVVGQAYPLKISFPPQSPEESLRADRWRAAVNLCELGLVSTQKETRWWAWLALWKVERTYAYAAVREDDDEFKKWFDEGGPWPGRLVLKEATKKFGREILLEANEPREILPLLKSTEMRERELGISELGIRILADRKASQKAAETQEVTGKTPKRVL